MAKIIRQYNGEAIIIPTLELQLVKSPELIEMVNAIDSYDWIIFTSPAGVKSFFNVFTSEKIPCNIATIGIKTEEELLKYDNKSDLIPDKFTAEGLLESFKSIDIKGKKIALPRTLSARTVLPEGLEDYGATVTIAEAYTSGIPHDKTSILDLGDKIINKEIDIITFTSPLTVSNLFDVLKEDDSNKFDLILERLKSDIIIASIGPITGNKLNQYNLQAIEPDKYTVKDMIDILLEKI